MDVVRFCFDEDNVSSERKIEVGANEKNNILRYGQRANFLLAGDKISKIVSTTRASPSLSPKQLK